MSTKIWLGLAGSAIAFAAAARWLQKRDAHAALAREDVRFHRAYDALRQEAAHQTPALVLVAGQMVFSDSAQRAEYPASRPASHLLKAAAHAPLGVYALLVPHVGAELPASLQSQLTSSRMSLEQAEHEFNNIDDRRSERPSLGVSCFDCHANGHSNAGTHLVGDIRPQQLRHRIDTPSLRGLNVQKIFGSQRSLSSVEDFTEFEQRAAYFDGDPVLATKKGVNPLDRGTQVQHMSEFQKLLDFPPAPKLGVDGQLDARLATEAELRGEELFHGKARCGDCHTGAFYTDNQMHDLKVERFYTPRVINDMQATADGPIKTFTLRGIKESPPYLHDGRLLTLDDVVEFFNLVLETKLTAEEKSDLLAFLAVL